MIKFPKKNKGSEIKKIKDKIEEKRNTVQNESQISEENIGNSEYNICNFQFDKNTLNCKEELSTWGKSVIDKILRITTKSESTLSQVERTPLKMKQKILWIMRKLNQKVQLPEIRDHQAKIFNRPRDLIAVLASHFYKNQEFWVSYWSNHLGKRFAIPVKKTQDLPDIF